MSVIPIDSARPPPSLKLAFTKAADYERVHDALYSEKARTHIPGSDQVISRDEYTVREALDGHATVLEAANNPKNVVAATMAYHADSLFTEIGSTMVSMPGFNAAALVVAALSLREHVRYPYRPQIAAIQSANAASTKVYHEKLGWRRDDANADKNREIVGPRPAPKGEKSWFRTGRESYAAQARVLLNFIADGGLWNQRTEQFVPVDFSSLDEAGLTQKRLQNLAEFDVHWRALARSATLRP